MCIRDRRCAILKPRTPKLRPHRQKTALPDSRSQFIAGAAGASLVWFSLLGFGARWLAPWFARPRAWQLLDGLIGATMFVLSALLVRHALIGM